MCDISHWKRCDYRTIGEFTKALLNSSDKKEVFHKFQLIARKIGIKYCFNPTQIEDLTASSLEKLLACKKEANYLGSNNNIFGFFYTICERLCIDMIRKSKSICETKRNLKNSVLKDHGSKYNPSLIELHQMLQIMLNEYSEYEVNLILKRVYISTSIRELANESDKTIPAMKSQINRIILKLRKSKDLQLLYKLNTTTYAA